MEKEKIIYREASHYNSWYMGPKNTLKKELDGYLSQVTDLDSTKKLKGMIVPHAGIMWSGATAAWGFTNIKNMKNLKRIFILGPSHFVDFPGCGISTASYWKTPFCDLQVDHKVYEELLLKDKEEKLFNYLPMKLDSYEHSLEIETPYIGYFLQDRPEVTIVPIMTGKLTYEEECQYADILLDYYKDDSNLFVISEDFCHWGKRHNFFFRRENVEDKIHESIEFLDNMAFEIIKNKDSHEFKEYLKKWKNNLCGGGSPITIYLAIVEKYIKSKNAEKENTLELMHYTKSDPKINSDKEEAVSYAVFLDYI